MTSTELKHDLDSRWAVQILENILRPIVRLLFNRHVGFQVVEAVLKRLFVETAYEAAVADNPFKKPTVSSIAVRSGVDVKDVKRELSGIEDNGEDLSWVPPTSPPIAVLEHWAEKPPFVDDNGEPVVLKAWGSGLSFERLVKRVCGNVGAAEIRDRLYDAGCITIDKSASDAGDYRLRLVKRFFEPDETAERDLLNMASHAIRHLAQTLGHNLNTDKNDRFLQQERWTLCLRAEDVKSFRKTIQAWARKCVAESEALIGDYEKDDFARPEHLHAGIGLYYFEESPGKRDQFQYAT